MAAAELWVAKSGIAKDTEKLATVVLVGVFAQEISCPLQPTRQLSLEEISSRLLMLVLDSFLSLLF